MGTTNGKFLTADSVNGSKVLLNNGQFLRGRSTGGSPIDIIRVSPADILEMASAPLIVGPRTESNAVATNAQVSTAINEKTSAKIQSLINNIATAPVTGLIGNATSRVMRANYAISRIFSGEQNADQSIRALMGTNYLGSANGFPSTQITSVNSVAHPSANVILVAGDFTAWGGVRVNRLIKMDDNYNLDQTFKTNIGTGFGSTVRKVIVHSSGKYIIVGSFTTFNGNTRNRIVMLNADGTEDTTFATNVGTAANNQITSVTFNPADGAIFLTGTFTNWNGTTVSGLCKISATGVFDTTFNTNIGTGPATATGGVAIHFDSVGNKLYLGGNFTTFNGTARNRFVALSAVGVIDTTFSTNMGTAFNNQINDIATDSTGRIIVVGNFTTFNALTRNYIVRLSTAGVEDSAFYTALGGNINTGGTLSDVIVNTSDNSIIAGGVLNAIGSVLVNRVFKLSNTGAIDNTFLTNIGYAAGVTRVEAMSIFSGTVQMASKDGFKTFSASTGVVSQKTGFAPVAGLVKKTIVQPDGKILVLQEQDGANLVVRLNANYSLDTTFVANQGSGATAIQQNTYGAILSDIGLLSNGKIIVAGNFTQWNGVNNINRLVLLNSDGTRDTAFSTAIGTGPNGIVNNVAVYPDDSFVICGTITNFNGTARQGMTKLNASGAEDSAFLTNLGTGFNIGPSAICYHAATASLYAGGSFTTFNGNTRNRMVKLNANGTEDAAFYTNLGTGFGAGGTPVRVIKTTATDVFVGGDFTSLNSFSHLKIAKMSHAGVIDETFRTNINVYSLGNIYSLYPTSEYLYVGGQILSGTLIGVNRFMLDGNSDTFFSFQFNNNPTNLNTICYDINQLSPNIMMIGVAYQLSALQGSSKYLQNDFNIFNDTFMADIENIEVGSLVVVKKTAGYELQKTVEYGSSDVTLSVDSASGQVNYATTNIIGDQIESEMRFYQLDFLDKNGL